MILCLRGIDIAGLWRKTLNAINLAKLLNFGEKDIKNSNVITHENAKKIFEKTLGRKRHCTPMRSTAPYLSKNSLFTSL
jgi:hypothetical protein